MLYIPMEAATSGTLSTTGLTEIVDLSEEIGGFRHP
jgi:hypothetical protein